MQGAEKNTFSCPEASVIKDTVHYLMCCLMEYVNCCGNGICKISGTVL